MEHKVRRHGGDRHMGRPTAVSKGAHSTVPPNHVWIGGQTRQEIGKALLHQASGDQPKSLVQESPRELITREWKGSSEPLKLDEA